MKSEDPSRQLALKIINKDKWWDILSRFIDVLRINIFIVDVQGSIILPPEERKYGGRLLTDKGLGLDLMVGAKVQIRDFEDLGDYLEKTHRFGLHSFAFPITIQSHQVIAYMIVSPVILNRRLSNEDYQKMADQHRVDFNQLMDEINGLRIISQLMIKSIIDLLVEIVRDNIELSIIEKELSQFKLQKEDIANEVKHAAEDIFTAVRMDELLVALLDSALKMAKAECGSIMILDEKSGELTIQVSRGLETEHFRNARQKLGEGIAGMAVQENAAYLIRGQESEEKIKKFLKRPEIKESLVMPLESKSRVYGVLNLSTKSRGGQISENIKNLKYLSRLVSSAV